ncbi:hypothetical protein THASP1DRAFT_30195 [Thamnocephalis sphaerospora]|uniref:DUF5614 domain-containing protein n=1 Tax=Thamnocephalis sphaerospora TaxID=78915 RepID=A0A4P9XPQ4_9FUNG|nr:hypothetical protein THASP1DRAFT_30195 [Thamnocephalis sphaerospora]|eukprot:RKP07994.1 hypothetical protein THASP1DRAFT_30195 [Thamnocephalis sphaerospora]
MTAVKSPRIALQHQQERADALHRCLLHHMARLEGASAALQARTANQQQWTLPDARRGLCDGLGKLATAVRAEMSALRKAEENPAADLMDMVASSNLSYLEAMAQCALTARGVVAVWRTYPPDAADKQHGPVCVDVVADWGRRWIKVTTRNPDALVRLLAQEQSKRSEDIPNLSADGDFWLTEGMALHPVQPYADADTVAFPLRATLNLDTTALMALCSEATHLTLAQLAALPDDIGVAELNRQHAEELAGAQTQSRFRRFLLRRVSPDGGGYDRTADALGDADTSCCGPPVTRRIVMAQPAWEKFHEIVSVVGGEHERARARQLRETGALDHLLLVSPEDNIACLDVDLQAQDGVQSHNGGARWPVCILPVEAAGISPQSSCTRGVHAVAASDRVVNLVGSLTPLQRVVFDLGDALQATTITANSRAMRVLDEVLGPEAVSIWLHPARSLCEQRLVNLAASRCHNALATTLK